MSMIGNRNSQHSFAQVPSVHTSRSAFDRSAAFKTTFQFDYLIPFFVEEILPGDTLTAALNHFARLSTQVVPVMDNIYIDFFYFYVPNRLLWDNWERMCGSQDNPGDSISYIAPQLTFATTRPLANSIYDQMGIPINNLTPAWTLKNTLPLRAYNLIWKDWFRDENLQNSPVINTDDGPDIEADYSLLKRNRKKDYFASALPWPQKGTAVSLPLGTSATVKRIDNAPDGRFRIAGTNSAAANGGITLATGVPFDSGSNPINYDPFGSLYADLSTATAATINAFRQAMQIQGLLELDARGGTRFTEILKAHFNVVSPDARLQRPEFLGSGSTMISSHPVAQTAPTSGTNYQGNLASFATSKKNGTGFSKSFVEHGYVIGLMCARADVTYQQGLNRMWDRSSRYDWFWPMLEGIGEQAILNKEIYLQGTSADTAVFGYQERYAEYRYKPSEIRGEFRSTYPAPLDQWHLAEKYGTLPSLNAAWIPQNTPISRLLADTATVAHILMDGFMHVTHVRPMKTYSVPVTLGRM